MSLREPRHRRTPDYSRPFLVQLHRETTQAGRQSASFVEMCDRASIPRDLRSRLFDRLLTEKYITRQGDTVSITSAGITVATMPG